MNYSKSSAETSENFSELHSENEDTITVPNNDHSEIPLYEKSFSEAMENGEISAFRLSARADNICKTAIEAAISDNYSDNRLNSEGAKLVVKMYGIDRVKKLLAITAIAKDCDGRISPENKAWAKTVCPNSSKDKIDLSLVIDGVNPGLTDIFIRQVRKIEGERKPSIMKKLEYAKENGSHSVSGPKKQEQVL